MKLTIQWDTVSYEGVSKCESVACFQSISSGGAAHSDEHAQVEKAQAVYGHVLSYVPERSSIR